MHRKENPSRAITIIYNNILPTSSLALQPSLLESVISDRTTVLDPPPTATPARTQTNGIGNFGKYPIKLGWKCSSGCITDASPRNPAIEKRDRRPNIQVGFKHALQSAAPNCITNSK